MRHASFIARTVFVQNNDVEAACRILNRILGREGILEQYRRTRYYEKPFQVINSIPKFLHNTDNIKVTDCTLNLTINNNPFLFHNLLKWCTSILYF